MTEHQPSPGDFNREDQPATSEGAACVQCGAPRPRRAKRFCSQRCWHQWSHEHPPRLDRPRPTHDQVMNEMRESYARAQKEVSGS